MHRRQEQVKAFSAFENGKHQVFHATVGPQDAVLLPVGFICAERVAAKADVVGFRVAILSLSDLADLEMWSKHFISQQAPDEVLHGVVDALTLIDE